MSKILDEVSKTTIKLLLDEPFYGHFFTGILKEVTKGVETMAVGLASTQMVKLYVNPDFWNDVLDNDDFKYGVLKHEILHVVLKHIISVKRFSNKAIFGIAADLVVNQYVAKNKLPEGALFLTLFPDLELKPDMDVGYYYDKLNTLWQNYLNKSDSTGNAAPGQAGTSPPGTSNPPSNNSSSNSSSNPTNNNSSSSNSNGGGSGSGSTPPGGSGDSPSDQPSSQQGNENRSSDSPSLEALKRLLSRDSWILKQHELWWKEVSKLSQAEGEILEGYIDQVIINSIKRTKTKNYGNLPGGVRQYLDLLLESLKPKVNWRRVMRLFAASSNRTYLKNTIRRPSKRYGTTPGIKVKRKQKVLVAIDTSGSIQMDELNEFFNEIYYIWRQGAEVLVVECDVKIHRQYQFKGTLPKLVLGRGGTDFNAPLQFANEEYIPDAIFYFTDGYAAVPEVKCRRPILWVISSNGMNKGEGVWEQLPGRIVKIEK